MSSESASLIEQYLDEVMKSVFFQDKNVRGSFANEVEFYRRRATWQRTPYRVFGLLIIALSITLPILAAFGEQLLIYKDLWVSIVAGVISLLTGINSFFRLDVGWKSSIETLLALEQLRNDWELKISKAKMIPDSTKGLILAIKVTEQFHARFATLVETETRGFFTVQQFPNNKLEVTGDS